LDELTHLAQYKPISVVYHLIGSLEVTPPPLTARPLAIAAWALTSAKVGGGGASVVGPAAATCRPTPPISEAAATNLSPAASRDSHRRHPI